MNTSTRTADLVVVGAGAAGLATAIFAARAAPGARVVCVDGARTIGAKILVSGGSRCNVTNRVVTERDFWGGSARVIARVLRAFPAERTVEFFASIGVTLREEDDGKLFPVSNRARTVLDALLREAGRTGVAMHTAVRVTSIERDGTEFVVDAGAQRYEAANVVLATGGRSLPKSGSDGFGYRLAMRCGHTCIETTPGLAPMLLGHGPHARLSGVAHPASLAVHVDRRLNIRLAGALLWTHFGASGPVVLNASRHWHRAAAEGREVALRLNVVPPHSFDSIDGWLQTMTRDRPRATVVSALATLLPVSVSSAWVDMAGITPDATMAHVTREQRRSLSRCLVDTELDVTGSRGYQYAEVTAGGIALGEINPATMESRVCEGLYLVGEILDIDGRLGGFNFQWAWSSGFVAGDAIGRKLRGEPAR